MDEAAWGTRNVGAIWNYSSEHMHTYASVFEKGAMVASPSIVGAKVVLWYGGCGRAYKLSRPIEESANCTPVLTSISRDGISDMVRIVARHEEMYVVTTDGFFTRWGQQSKGRFQYDVHDS